MAVAVAVLADLAAAATTAAAAAALRFPRSPLPQPRRRHSFRHHLPTSCRVNRRPHQQPSLHRLPTSRPVNRRQHQHRLPSLRHLPTSRPVNPRRRTHRSPRLLLPHPPTRRRQRRLQHRHDLHQRRHQRRRLQQRLQQRQLRVERRFALPLPQCCHCRRRSGMRGSTPSTPSSSWRCVRLRV